MRYMRPEYIDEETWARLPEEARRQLDATPRPPDQRYPHRDEAEGSTYAIFGEPTAPNEGPRNPYVP
jgi:hypothetical protein